MICINLWGPIPWPSVLAHHWLSVLLQLFVLPKDRQVHEAIDTASLGDGRRRGWEAQASRSVTRESCPLTSALVCGLVHYGLSGNNPAVSASRGGVGAPQPRPRPVRPLSVGSLSGLASSAYSRSSVQRCRSPLPPRFPSFAPHRGPLPQLSCSARTLRPLHVGSAQVPAGFCGRLAAMLSLGNPILSPPPRCVLPPDWAWTLSISTPGTSPCCPRLDPLGWVFGDVRRAALAAPGGRVLSAPGSGSTLTGTCPSFSCPNPQLLLPGTALAPGTPPNFASSRFFCPSLQPSPDELSGRRYGDALREGSAESA